MNYKMGIFGIMCCLSLRAEWAEETLKGMSLKEKIGQLFFVAVRSNPDGEDERFNDISNALDLQAKHDRAYAQLMIDDYHVGGVLFISFGDADKQHRFTLELQRQSKVPLMFVQDNEWRLSLLYDTVKFPYPLTMGALRDNTLIYELGKEVARECKLIDIHSNLSPVVDINNNPLNPIIGPRSFGENKQKVTEKALAFYKGLVEGGVLPCAKHFPGHGDVMRDSHQELPRINHPLSHLESIELYPYMPLIKEGLPIIMTAHLEVPALDPAGGPVSLSKKVITELLRHKMGFNGIVMSDALSMHGVTDGHEVGELELAALRAGNDVLLYSKDVPLGCAKIEHAVLQGALSEAEIDEHVLRILKAKEQFGLHRKTEKKHNVTLDQLNTPEAYDLKKKLFSEAITLVKNEHVLPFVHPDSIAVITIGARAQDSSGETEDAFVNQLRNYSFKYGTNFKLTMNCTKQEIDALCQKIASYDVVVFALYSMDYQAGFDFGISQRVKKFIHDYTKSKHKTLLDRLKIFFWGEQKKQKVVLVLFASPYALKFFGDEDAIIVGYEPDVDAQRAAADVIFGAINPSGTLPVTASNKFTEGMQLCFNYKDRNNEL